MARLTGLEPATLGVTGRYSNHLSYNRAFCDILSHEFTVMARLTGLEPATLGVTGRYSNQLSYNRSLSPSLGVGGVLRVRLSEVKNKKDHKGKLMELFYN